MTLTDLRARNRYKQFGFCGSHALVCIVYSRKETFDSRKYAAKLLVQQRSDGNIDSNRLESIHAAES